MLSKSQLAIALSKLAVFENPDTNLEQYPTESEVAAEFLHHAAMSGDIQGKHVLDLGCGTGILGIGALLLGASKVTFLDIDENALRTLRINLDASSYSGETDIIHGACMPVACDTVVMNPPFGTKQKHADKAFLEAAADSADSIYSLHLGGSEGFIQGFADERKLRIAHSWQFHMALKQSMKQHTKAVERVSVLGICLKR